LILGLGTTLVVQNAIAILPILGLPFIRTIFSSIVSALSSSLDSNIKKNLNIVVIRWQNDQIKKEYDEIINKIREHDEGKVLSEEEYRRELEKAKSAIDNLVNRNR